MGEFDGRDEGGEGFVGVFFTCVCAQKCKIGSAGEPGGTYDTSTCSNA